MAVDWHRTITEASKITGYKPHVIRFYEKEFGLRFPRNKANHRYFTNVEIDQLNTIKRLQEKGYSNTQIKLILSNPDLISKSIEDMGDVAVTHVSSYMSNNQMKHFDEQMDHMKKEIIEEIRNQFEFHQQPYRMALTGLAEEVKELAETIKAKGQMIPPDDAILSENVKLKTQIRQKTYEILDLKEQLRKEKQLKRSFWKRILEKITRPSI
ncbi:MAG: MerR family transcriptional regulator [Clostridia bacterium]|jgi:DNA-binding transcriptional MerR regulator